MFDKDELLFRENLMDHAGRLVPAHAEDTKKRHPHQESSASPRITEKAETITNAVSKWHSIRYRAFANYLAFRDVPPWLFDLKLASLNGLVATVKRIDRLDGRMLDENRNGIQELVRTAPRCLASQESSTQETKILAAVAPPGTIQARSDMPLITTFVARYQAEAHLSEWLSMGQSDLPCGPW